MNFSHLLTKNDLEKRVSTDIAFTWVQFLFKKFHKPAEALNYLNLKKGLTQELQDELYPVCKYVKLHYDDPNLFVQYYSGSENSYDADILKTNGDVFERLEVTMAIDGIEKTLQAETLNKFGHSKIYETPKYSGNVKNRVIEEPESSVVDSSDIIVKQSKLLQNAYNNKHDNLKKYPKTTLLIGVDLPLLLPFELSKIVSSLKVHDNTFQSIKCVNIADFNYWIIK